MKALSEPNRLEIVRLVKANVEPEGCSCVSVLNQLDISQSTFSHHVSELRDAGILNGEPQGRTVKLTLNHDLLKEIQEKIDLLK